jgi:hypothetical protein
MRNVFNEVKRAGPLTSSQIIELGAPHALDTLRSLSAVSPEFEQILNSVWLAGSDLQVYSFPSLEQFRHALATGEDKYAEKLLEQLRCAASSAVNQHNSAVSV